MTAEEIIEGARDFSPLFTRQSIPDTPALKALGRLERQLADVAMLADPDSLAEWYEISPLPEDWEEGILLPPYLRLLGAEVRYAGPPEGAWYVSLTSPAQAKTMPHLYPSVSTMGDRLYLTDARDWFGTRSGWEEAVSLRLRIVPAIGNLTRLSSRIMLPPVAEAALVSGLAWWMATRLGLRGAAAIRDQAMGAQQAWVLGIGQMAATRTWLVEVVE